MINDDLNDCMFKITLIFTCKNLFFTEICNLPTPENDFVFAHDCETALERCISSTSMKLNISQMRKTPLYT